MALTSWTVTLSQLSFTHASTFAWDSETAGEPIFDASPLAPMGDTESTSTCMSVSIAAGISVWIFSMVVARFFWYQACSSAGFGWGASGPPMLPGIVLIARL